MKKMPIYKNSGYRIGEAISTQGTTLAQLGTNDIEWIGGRRIPKKERTSGSTQKKMSK